MKQPLFPSTIGTQSRFAYPLGYFLTVKAAVRKFGKSDGQTGSRCLDKAVLAQRGVGGTTIRDADSVKNCNSWGKNSMSNKVELAAKSHRNQIDAARPRTALVCPGYTEPTPTPA